jgi:hypothetical protein
MEEGIKTTKRTIMSSIYEAKNDEQWSYTKGSYSTRAGSHHLSICISIFLSDILDQGKKIIQRCWLFGAASGRTCAFAFAFTFGFGWF